MVLSLARNTEPWSVQFFMSLLDTQMKYEFLPQSVPSYSAVEVLSALQAKHPAFAY